MKKNILIVFGTRPEAIKMAPVIKEFQKHPTLFNLKVCVTAQHREMLDQVLNIFEITPDYDLDIMKQNQTLADIISKILKGMNKILQEVSPDLVLVHGDTITSTAVAMAAFYEKIAVAHVEAGLRTYNIYSPWPEEMNRQMTARLTSIHYAPTKMSKNNLISENINQNQIIITGNTVIDALFLAEQRVEKKMEVLKTSIVNSGYNIERLAGNKKMVLITGHRRESFGKGFENICNAILLLAKNNPNIDFVYPVHLNPNVQEVVNRILGSDKGLKNVFLIKPVEYLEFIVLMKKSYIILTDSGGIQEEAPSFGKPVLVMRDTTERPEAVESGVARLVGTDINNIVNSINKLVSNSDYYNSIANKSNPYGDGKASEKIVKHLINYFELNGFIV